MLSKELRQKIVQLYQKGKKQPEISYLLDIPQSTISYWIVRHKQTGDVASRPRSGRPTRLTKTQLEELRKTLHDEPPAQYGGAKIGWSTKFAIKYVKDTFCVAYSVRRMQELFHRLGLSLITPRSEHQKGSHAARTVFRADFKKNSKRNIWVPTSSLSTR